MYTPTSSTPVEQKQSIVVHCIFERFHHCQDLVQNSKTNQTKPSRIGEHCVTCVSYDKSAILDMVLVAITQHHPVPDPFSAYARCTVETQPLIGLHPHVRQTLRYALSDVIRCCKHKAGISNYTLRLIFETAKLVHYSAAAHF